MKNKAQEWFLLKKNWIEELHNLSNEEFGALVRAMHTSSEPEGNLITVYRLLKDEYDRVNQSRELGLAKRREASLKGVLARTGSTPHVIPQELPEVNRTHTHTRTSTDTGTDTGKGIGDIELANLLRSKLAKINQTEIVPLESLMNGTFLE